MPLDPLIEDDDSLSIASSICSSVEGGSEPESHLSGMNGEIYVFPDCFFFLLGSYLG